MCGRYVITAEVSSIEKRFNLSLKSEIEIIPNYNVGPGQFAPVILNHNPKELILSRFGYTPSWKEKSSRLTINARVDNKDTNPNDDMNYFKRGGSPGIFHHKYWSSAIRNQRCIVIADAFYEGSKEDKLNKPYLVHMRNKQRPFAMAGVWSQFTDKDGVQQSCFAILTVPANKLLHKIGHHRSPVIIPNHLIQNYLLQELRDISSLLVPYDSSFMNAYPVSSRMKNWKENDKSLVNPIGELLVPEFEDKMIEKIKLEGMGDRKNNKRTN